MYFQWMKTTGTIWYDLQAAADVSSIVSYLTSRDIPDCDVIKTKIWGKRHSWKIPSSFSTSQPITGRWKPPKSPCWFTHLWAGLQIIVQHVNRDSEVSSVEGVGTVPALGAKLAPLCHHGMEITEDKQDALELILPGAHLQSVLQYRQRGRAVSVYATSQVSDFRQGWIDLPHQFISA